MAQPLLPIPELHLPPNIANLPLPVPNFANMAQHALAASQALTDLSQNGQILSQSITHLAGGIAHVQNMPAVADVNIQVQILQALNALTNSVNQGNQRLNVVTQRLDAMQETMNQRFDDVDERLVNVEASIDELAELISWEQNAATARTMNSLNPLGPYNPIPSKPSRAAYTGVFPPNSKAINSMTTARCRELAEAWGIDIAGTTLGEKKKRIARFIGVNYTI